jgi:2'-5' RNA ligase
MSFFLGFIPDRESNYKIRKVVGTIGMIFNDFGIPVRWVKPSSYHITLYYLGERYSLIKRFLLKKKISKISFKPIHVSFGTVKVGISRKYKELVYLEVVEGGEELRKLLLEVRRYLGGNDVSMFVPHLTIGRVSKDLSQEEYRNIAKDVTRVSKSLKVKDISFNISEMYLIQSKNGTYSLEMKFDAS